MIQDITVEEITDAYVNKHHDRARSMLNDSGFQIWEVMLDAQKRHGYEFPYQFISIARILEKEE